MQLLTLRFTRFGATNAARLHTTRGKRNTHMLRITLSEVPLHARTRSPHHNTHTLKDFLLGHGAWVRFALGLVGSSCLFKNLVDKNCFCMGTT